MAAPTLDGCQARHLATGLLRQVQPHVLLGRRAWLKQLQEESQAPRLYSFHFISLRLTWSLNIPQAEKTRPLRRLWAEDFRQKLRSCRTHAAPGCDFHSLA